MTRPAHLARAFVPPLLLLWAGGCSDSTAPPTAASLHAASPVAQEAPAGAAVAQPPSVLVRDQNGSPLPGAAVSFVVASGGGAISPGSVTTNSSGVATLTSWTLGDTPGINVVRASAAGTTITFSASGIQVPTFLSIVTFPQQQVVAGTTLHGQPGVLVTDQAGRPMAGVTVNFAVTSGASTVTPATVVTGAESTAEWGVARVTSWHLPTVGVHTVTATVPGLTAAHFIANAVDPSACNPVASVVIPGSTGGALSATDCALPTGKAIDYYLLEVAARTVVRLRAVSTEFDAFLLLSTSSGEPVAENDDDGMSFNSEIVAVLAPGSYHVGVTSFLPGVTGAYTLMAETATEGAPRSCEPPWSVMPGVSVSGVLAPSECEFDGRHIDLYQVFVAAGETVRITMSSIAVDPYLLFLDANFGLIENDNHEIGTTDARITYTAPASGFYLVVATSAQRAEGAYTLAID